MKGMIKRIAYIGWRGFDYEEIELGESITGLVGRSGAGKSTLMMCLDYALLPDRKVLEIVPISDVKDTHNAGKDILISRINPDYGYAYVVFDILTRHGNRLLAGICAHGEDGQSELTRFYIDNLPNEISLHDAFCIVDGEDQYYPDFQELKKSLAVQGVDIHVCRRVGDYGQVLYDAGVLPTNLSDSTDRTLYAKLIESAFRGGISSEVATNLKDYLLPEEKRIPQTVKKLQECTAQVFSTRQTLEDATVQLKLLQATYGAGKEIILHALRHEAEAIENSRKEIVEVKGSLTSNRDVLEEKKNTYKSLSDEIKLTEESIETLRAGAEVEVREATADKDNKYKDHAQCETSWRLAKENLKKLKQGQQTWMDLAGDFSNRDPDWIERKFNDDICDLHREKARIEIRLEQLQEERHSLEGGSSNPKAAALAEMLDGRTLEEALDEASDQDARAIEMALNGLADGVVGVSVDRLADLESGSDLPDIFWMGGTPPTPETIREIGDWQVLEREGFSIVSSKARRAVFGRKHREARIQSIDDEIRKASERQQKIKTDLEGISNNLKTLQNNHESIGYFIVNRDSIYRIEEEEKSAHDNFDQAARAYDQASQKLAKLQGDLIRITEPHEKNLSKLKENILRTKADMARLESLIPEAERNLQNLQAQLADQESRFASIRSELGEQAESLLAESEQINVDELKAPYAVAQTKRIDELGRALESELPARVALIQEAIATDPMSCIRLWPMLLEVLRDRIVADLADTDGVDLLSKMKDRRNELDSTLRLQENEVKIKARSLHGAIQQSVRSQSTRIKALSKLGSDIRFGNVTGMRIDVRQHKYLLDILESFADQPSLFSSNSKPVDQALEEFFDMVSEDYNYSGEQLLDYRTYMDLVIEAKRKGSDKWGPAASLSGGESIGGGLAVALMLFRALSNRGEIKPEQITPLFAIDEISRLDAEGQKVVVDLAKREGFQVFMTAVDLKPSYDCSLYSLERVFDPDERLIIRGMKKKKVSA